MLGFGADIKTSRERDLGTTLELVEPEDLIRYGLIPEFVGRLPVIGALHELDKPALMQILTQPRNAITRQYERLFEYENVKLGKARGPVGAVLLVDARHPGLEKDGTALDCRGLELRLVVAATKIDRLARSARHAKLRAHEKALAPPCCRARRNGATDSPSCGRRCSPSPAAPRPPYRKRVDD